MSYASLTRLAVCLEQNLRPVVKRSFYYWGELFSTKIQMLIFKIFAQATKRKEADGRNPVS